MSISSDETTVSDTSGKTNTIAITALPKAYFDPLILALLQNHFETYGEINQWAPLPGFGRIIVVYNEDDHAELAKQHSDPIVLDGTDDRPQVTLRVYRADPTPLSAHAAEMHHLRPPALDKNFLISPPGSPPVGWEQVREDPPNSTPLAEDLMTALRKLQIQQTRGSGREILLDPDEGSGVGVFVEDFDGDDQESYDVSEEDWVYGESAPARNKWTPTALPPMRATAIVA